MKTSPCIAISVFLLLAEYQLVASAVPEAAGIQAEGGASQPAPSGFLGDYSQLKPAPDAAGVSLYIDRSGNYRSYTKLLIEPVQVLYTPGPGQQQLQLDVVERMAHGFQESMRRVLEPDYQIVTVPGPDVLRVRGAITNVQAVATPTGASDFLPIKALFNAGRAVAGKSPRLVEMTAELEVQDPNGKRVIAATATRKGDKKLSQGDQITWDTMQSTSDYWARGFRARLEELRSGSARPR